MTPQAGLARSMNEPRRVFTHLRKVFGDRRPRKDVVDGDGEHQPFQPGRDPRSLASAFDTLTESMGWSGPLGSAELVAKWPQIVGESIAAHTTPLGVDDGQLVIHTDSTAWATQLRLIRQDVLATLAKEVPHVRLDGIVVRGPGAPSWKSGPRAVPGRGPRDTYG